MFINKTINKKKVKWKWSVIAGHDKTCDNDRGGKKEGEFSESHLLVFAWQKEWKQVALRYKLRDRKKKKNQEIKITRDRD